jgi:hypothetical protein
LIARSARFYLTRSQLSWALAGSAHSLSGIMCVKRVLMFSFLLTVGLGTSCASVRRARQTVTPAPDFECLASALASSTDVAEVSQRYRKQVFEGFLVVLRDSTAKDGLRNADISRQWRSTEKRGQLEVSFSWPGAADPPGAEVRATMLLADRLLNYLHAACTSQKPMPTMCDHGNGKWKACSAAG